MSDYGFWALTKKERPILHGPFRKREEAGEHIEEMQEKHGRFPRHGTYGAESFSELLRQLLGAGEVEFVKFVERDLGVNAFFFTPSVLEVLEKEGFHRSPNELAEAMP